jgi:hypothetical protein
MSSVIAFVLMLLVVGFRNKQKLHMDGVAPVRSAANLILSDRLGQVLQV